MSDQTVETLTAGSAPPQEAGVITKSSRHPFAETVQMFLELLGDRGAKVFAVIHHSEEARHIGLPLRDTTLIIFGNPSAGTPAMAAKPLIALELPLKVLIWDDYGQTRVSYVSPHALAERYGLSDDLARVLAVTGPLTDILLA